MELEGAVGQVLSAGEVRVIFYKIEVRKELGLKSDCCQKSKSKSMISYRSTVTAAKMLASIARVEFTKCSMSFLSYHIINSDTRIHSCHTPSTFNSLFQLNILSVHLDLLLGRDLETM